MSGGGVSGGAHEAIWETDRVPQRGDILQDDPDRAGFIPLSDRSLREQARFLIRIRSAVPTARAVFGPRDEQRRRGVVRYPHGIPWAVQD